MASFFRDFHKVRHLANHSPHRGRVLKDSAASDFAQSQAAQCCGLRRGTARLTAHLPDSDLAGILRWFSHLLCPCRRLGPVLRLGFALLDDFGNGLAATLCNMTWALLLFQRIEG